MSEERQLTVTTPGLVDMALPVAPLGRRMLARFIDELLQVVLILLLVWGVSLVMPAGWQPSLDIFTTLFGIVGLLFLIDAWHILFEWLWRGRTPGKVATGIAVVSADGSAPSFRECFIRGVLRLVDFMPSLYFGGLFIIWITPHDQRFGDLAAGTLVIDTSPAAALIGGGDERRLTSREQLDPGQTAILQHYFTRRPDLTPSQRAYFAPRIARLAGLDPDEFSSGRELENTLYNMLREQQ